LFEFNFAFDFVFGLISFFMSTKEPKKMHSLHSAPLLSELELLITLNRPRRQPAIGIRFATSLNGLEQSGSWRYGRIDVQGIRSGFGNKLKWFSHRPGRCHHHPMCGSNKIISHRGFGINGATKHRSFLLRVYHKTAGPGFPEDIMEAWMMRLLPSWRE
jgi:hypothetical protein